ncbi:hypothetical protein [Chthoniobacter flavus]|uniref:hypothetical protein n=1 Tax=Chthoniobacter flavus TaxID=191863 RepID=UPI0010456E1E|nr:hypothetical protein [Chthoniobacter flavus]
MGIGRFDALEWGYFQQCFSGLGINSGVDWRRYCGNHGGVSERIEKLQVVINGFAASGCLVLAVLKGHVAFKIWEARGAANAAIQGIGMLLLVVSAVLILQRIRAGALLGMLASIWMQRSIVVATGAYSLMTYIVIHIIVLWLNAAAWKFMGSTGKSN